MEEDLWSSQDELRPPQQERWAPLGAASSPDPVIFSEPRSLNSENDRLKALENDKEELQQSLLSLTSRFAQIQFRLHQITEADAKDQPKLLEELDNLANQGCIDSSSIDIKKDPELTESSVDNRVSAIEEHESIIQQLKHQLDDLERYAFKHGSGGIPQSVMLQKQQVVLEQLMAKLNLNVNSDELADATVEDLKKRVDSAVEEVVNPAKIKEKLVGHLQTQIQDLERFIQFLQVEGESTTTMRSSGSVPQSAAENSSQKKESLALLRRALSVIQMFTITQLGCGSKELQSETMSDCGRIDSQYLLNDLKHAVNKVKTCIMSENLGENYDSDGGEVNRNELFYEEHEDGLKATASVNKLTHIVRKELCPAIISLLGHGLVIDATVSSNTGMIVPITCVLPKKFNSSLAAKPLHPWELFMEYYEMKHGAELAKAPARMLTRSFDLEPLVSNDRDHRITIKHSLLEAINIVLNDHNPLRRSHDIMLKALICIGLNSAQLTLWIRLLMKTSALISTHYTDYSYVAQTGFEGALTILSRLESLSFSLPEDLAVRPFKNIRDAF